MLTKLCQELRNWFEREKYFGDFKIENGSLDVSGIDIKDGQYFRIIGSVFNDGVHQYKTQNMEKLADEEFRGAIWTMAVPPAVVSLSERIQTWETTYGEAVSSPYSAESFGGYSYQKAGAGQGSANSTPTWQSTFASELNLYRKI
jgi:hypothetical protein